MSRRHTIIGITLGILAAVVLWALVEIMGNNAVTARNIGFLDVVMMLAAFIAVFVTWLQKHSTPMTREQFLRRHGLCEHCGYDLRGNGSGTCPECGGSWPTARQSGRFSDHRADRR